MDFHRQDLTGLEAAYFAVYKRPLCERVAELVEAYPDALDRVCTELNPNNPVPCFWSISDLAKQYGITKA